MKYLLAFLLVFSGIVEAAPCTEVFDQFIKHLGENNKTEAIKLVDPNTRLYQELANDTDRKFSSSVANLRHQLLVFAAIRMETTDFNDGTCGIDMVGLDGPSKSYMAWGRTRSLKGKITVSSYGILSFQGQQHTDIY